MSKKIIFMGTPTIACSVLETLLTIGDVEIVGVCCQPDKINGRNNKITLGPVKELCLKHNLKLFQPEKIGQIYDELAMLEPDMIITCAYGQFIPTKILELPKYKCINIHASLLPKYRGGAPIQWAILNNEIETGISLMYMVQKMDAGDIIFQEKVNIDFYETYDSLYLKLTNLACEMIKKYFHKLFNNNIKTIPQDINYVTYGYNINKENQIINFHNSSVLVLKKILGLLDKPKAIWKYKDNDIKIGWAKISSYKSILPPGKITKIDHDGIHISTYDNDIIITKLQLPNKNMLEVKALINGNHPFVIENNEEI